MKTLITEEHRHINPKYGVQSVERNCARWLMFSQHYDALPFPNNDRRVEIVANPTVCKDATYYTRLYALLEDEAFIGSVWQLLRRRDLSTFDAGEHATMNEAKRRAVTEMKTDVEQAVEDFKDGCERELVSRRDIAAGVNQFGRPEVSRVQLSHAINSAGMKLTNHKVKDAFGVWHWVVIVKGEWTVEQVKGTGRVALLKAMDKKTERADGTGRVEDDPL